MLPAQQVPLWYNHGYQNGNYAKRLFVKPPPPSWRHREELLRIVHWGKAKKFMRRYPNASAPLFHWRAVLRQARVNSFADLRDTFASADQVGEYTVFNIGGNNFRLIAMVVFVRDTAYIREILTHSEYDENKWRR